MTPVEALIRLTESQPANFRAAGACLVVGLLMRYVGSARTLTGMAFLGATALTAVFLKQVIGIYLLNLASFGYVRLISRAPRAHRWTLSAAGMIALVVVFAVQSAGWTPRGVGPAWLDGAIVLDMLLLMRLLLFIWEYGAERLDYPGSLEFLAWCGLPFACVSQVVRFTEFRGQQPMKTPPLRLGREWWVELATRIGLLILAAGFVAIYPFFEHSGLGGKLVIIFGLGPWGFYLTAAGLAGIARLSGRLGGLDIPVNWRSPFASRNIALFWTRWNITITNAFRDMLFYNRWGLARPNLYLNSIFVFLAVGAWHAINPYWLIFGLWHGVGFCVFIRWRQWRGPTSKPLPSALGWMLTYSFVCLGWAVPPQLLKLFRVVFFS